LAYTTYERNQKLNNQSQGLDHIFQQFCVKKLDHSARVELTYAKMDHQLEFSSFGETIGSSERRRPNSSSFNSQMLVLAREACGFTQKELADRMAINQSRLSRIEADEIIPNENDLRGFVNVLARSREFFFQQGAAMPASVSFYRKRHSLPLKLLRQCNAEMNVRRLDIQNRVGRLKLGTRHLPFYPPQQNGGAAAVAKKLRAAWNLDGGPVLHLTKLVEGTGCVIVDYSFPSSKLDGVCIRAPQQAPVIFLHRDLPKSRRRLSLAHELGHLIMHDNPHENVEDEAWEFASEFLMPSSEIEDKLQRLTLAKLCDLKKEWGVSMQAILYRASKLRLISESSCRFLWMQIGKCGYRLNEPFEDVIPDETPTPVEERMKTCT
jgi:Zn-dependent peptidase ImmA (M78 family)/transcriptional regulator with XRE-family HTH domain